MDPTSWPSRTFRLRSNVVREFLAELLGSYVFMAYLPPSHFPSMKTLGLGSTVSYGLHPDIYGCLYVHVGWGVAAALAVWISFSVSGAHFNPAVTLAMALIGHTRWLKVLIYWVAQYVGAFAAAATVYLLFKDAFHDIAGGTNGNAAAADVFVPYPQAHLSIAAGLLDQTIGTLFLVMGAVAVTDFRNAAPPAHLLAIPLGLIVTIDSMVFGQGCVGATCNPARDLSPRLFTAIVGLDGDTFAKDNHFFWIPLVAPHIGAGLGALFYLAFVGIHIPSVSMGTLTPASSLDILDA